MLLTLSVRNVVLIDRLDLAFKPGLCVLTGETGAGKSILLDALGLALGARVDPSLIRAAPGREAGAAAVSAVFDIARDHDAIAVIEEHGLAPPAAGEPLILRRAIAPDGRSRGFVNDQPAAAQLLRAVGATLVEIVGQFASHELVERASHRRLLDLFGGLNAQRRRVSEAWTGWRAAESALAEATRTQSSGSSTSRFITPSPPAGAR